MTDRERGGEDTVNAMESVVQFKGKLEAARLKELNESHGLRVGAPEPLAPGTPSRGVSTTERFGRSMARKAYCSSTPARNQGHQHHTFVVERSDLWLPPFTAIGGWADPEREAPAMDWTAFETAVAAQSPI